MRLALVALVVFSASGFGLAARPEHAAAQSDCSPYYPDFCIPNFPPDLNCPDIGYRGFTVLQPDPHGFDADEDGFGCESFTELPTYPTPVPTSTTAATNTPSATPTLTASTATNTATATTVPPSPTNTTVIASATPAPSRTATRTATPKAPQTGSGQDDGSSSGGTWLFVAGGLTLLAAGAAARRMR